MLHKAWANPDHGAAPLAALKALTRKLEQTHPDAARSLREGMEETLTLTRLGVAGALKKLGRPTPASTRDRSGD